ncbi:TonB-dependent receptor [Mucilaginibacter yixingensis]|uniref:TonB-dependent receptor n=1 Tax=Mucilaginibacter yixingensis TaxID=1295612 RepID=A0A2T5J8X2_9SPHI|nr:TonB-dependent receptor [Mucilaginibacter yixingensis]PTQ96521.1 TonB-dependent receptor [Mucilaginibacter yixingensis]
MVKILRSYLLITILACVFYSSAQAQITGKISGKITDAKTGENLIGANLLIQGTTKGAVVNVNGDYVLNIAPGTYALSIQYVGYKSRSISEVQVQADQVTTLNITLEHQGKQLKEVVIVQSKASREKETALLAEQKRSVEMKQAIGSQEMAKKGVSNAAAAVTKTAGIVKLESTKNVFVRGLGDRYNSTSLNGLPLPSEDPLYKNISLDFFQSNIIRNINVNKTFGAPLYGDNAGANIDISSKELEDRRFFSIYFEGGVNSNAVSASRFAVADGAFSYFGFLKNGRNTPITDLTRYTFNSGFQTEKALSPINTSFNISGGRKFNLGKSTNSLSLFGVASNVSDYSYRTGFIGQATNTGDYQQAMDVKRYDYKTTQSLLGNAKFRHTKGSVSLNSLFIHSDAQFVGNYLGYNKDINDNLGSADAENSLIVRQQNNSNNLFSNQLLADYKFSSKISANIGTVYSTLRGTEPDRKTNAYAMTASGSYILSANSPGDNNRFFSLLDENDLGTKAEVNYQFNPDANFPVVLTLGGNYRKTDRTFNFTEFDYQQGGLSVDPNNPDAALNQQNLSAGAFKLITLWNSSNLDPMYYIGHRKIGAGYAQLVYPVSENFIIEAGLRSENVKQTITWNTNITSTVTDLTTPPSLIDKNYLLPSLNMKYSFNDNNALRFAASETYTMPQFKEMANFLYNDINFNERGNPYLSPSKDHNVDLKYDHYLSRKEIISVGAFYKNIQNPIVRMIMNTPGLDYSYVNTKSANVAGAEVELRKTLYTFKGKKSTSDLSFGFNASYLYSQEDQTDVTTGLVSATFTNQKGKMQGASPLLINSDLSYSMDNDKTSLLSTLVFNYAYDKVFSVGTTGRENVLEKAVPSLDIINSFGLKRSKLTINLGGRNLLDPKFELTQRSTSNVTGKTTDVLISSYKRGITLFLGLSWHL